jgi:hypothetical protein
MELEFQGHLGVFNEELYIRTHMLIWLQQNSDKHNFKPFGILSDFTNGEKNAVREKKSRRPYIIF